MNFELCGNLFVPAHMRAEGSRGSTGVNRAQRRSRSNRGYSYHGPQGPDGAVYTAEPRVQMIVEREDWAKLDMRRRYALLLAYGFDLKEEVEISHWSRTKAESPDVEGALVPSTEKGCDIIEYVQRW